MGGLIVRLGVRRLIVLAVGTVVAVAGTVLVWEVRTARSYLRLASEFAQEAEVHRLRAEEFHQARVRRQAALDQVRTTPASMRGGAQVRHVERDVERLRRLEIHEGRLASHFETLHFKYSISARYPWESVAPDPPLPPAPTPTLEMDPIEVVPAPSTSDRPDPQQAGQAGLAKRPRQ